MSGVDPECRRADILQTIKMLGSCSAEQVVVRSGYDPSQVLATMRELQASGVVGRSGKNNATKWRLLP